MSHLFLFFVGCLESDLLFFPIFLTNLMLSCNFRFIPHLPLSPPAPSQTLDTHFAVVQEITHDNEHMKSQTGKMPGFKL